MQKAKVDFVRCEVLMSRLVCDNS